MQKQMADKELQVKKDYDVCDHLQQDLHSVMQDIAKETTEIKHLEEQLESGEVWCVCLCAYECGHVGV